MKETIIFLGKIFTINKIFFIVVFFFKKYQMFFFFFLDGARPKAIKTLKFFPKKFFFPYFYVN